VIRWLQAPGQSEWVNTLPETLGMRLVAIAVFFALQFLLIYGAGTVRVSRSPVRRGIARISTVVLLAVAMAFLSGAAILLFLTFSGRDGLLADLETWMFVSVLVGTWAFWTVAGLLAVWRTEPDTFLGRAFGILLGTSWIEFVLALALATLESPDETCPCERGSWWTLLFAVPLLLWALGPAIVLLLFREARLASLHPGRLRRVLARKTRRSEP